MNEAIQLEARRKIVAYKSMLNDNLEDAEKFLHQLIRDYGGFIDTSNNDVSCDDILLIGVELFPVDGLTEYELKGLMVNPNDQNIYMFVVPHTESMRLCVTKEDMMSEEFEDNWETLRNSNIFYGHAIYTILDNISEYL